MIMDWIIGASIPIVVGVIASIYVSWKAKVAADGIKDWRDDVVDAVDKYITKAKDDNK